jgi:hypothetical protein
MKNLIIQGNPDLRKGGRIQYDGDEYTVYSINVQGEWHGPDRPQLWCTIGSEDERETFETQEYIPMHLPTEDVAVEDIEVLRERAEP